MILGRASYHAGDARVQRCLLGPRAETLPDAQPGFAYILLGVAARAEVLHALPGDLPGLPDERDEVLLDHAWEAAERLDPGGYGSGLLSLRRR